MNFSVFHIYKMGENDSLPTLDLIIGYIPMHISLMFHIIIGDFNLSLSFHVDF